jgi:hypothetical protein
MLREVLFHFRIILSLDCYASNMKRFSLIKLQTLSEISRDISLVLFAALFIDNILRDGNLKVIFLGLSSSIACWVISLVLAEK